MDYYLGTPGFGPDPDFEGMAWEEIVTILDDYARDPNAAHSTYPDPSYEHICVYRETPDGYGCAECMYG